MPKKIIFFSLALIFYLSASQLHAQTLTWKDCLLLTSKNHPQLKAGQQSLIQSKLAIGQIDASLWPQFSTGYAGQRSKSTTNSTSDSYSLKLSASQLLFDGSKTVLQSQKAQNELQKAERVYEDLSASVRLSVRQSFLDIIKNQKLLELNQKILQRRKQQYDLISLYYDSGREHKGALLEAKANLFDAQTAFETTKQQIIVSKIILGSVLGIEKVDALAVTGDLVLDKIEKQPDFNSLVMQNFTYQKALNDTISTEIDLKISKSQNWPVITANGNYGFSDNQVLPQTNNWSYGVNVSYNLWDWGIKDKGIESTISKFEQAKATEINILQGTLISLRDTWLNSENAVRQTEVAKNYLISSQERAKIADVQYSTGLITYDSWLLIQNDLVSREKSYLTALYNAMIAQANWEKIKGRTVENEI